VILDTSALIAFRFEELVKLALAKAATSPGRM